MNDPPPPKRVYPKESFSETIESSDLGTTIAFSRKDYETFASPWHICMGLPDKRYLNNRGFRLRLSLTCTCKCNPRVISQT